MNKRILARALLSLTAVTLLSLPACASQKTVTEREKFPVTRGNIVESVNADGSLSLPLDRKLMFGTSGTVEQVNVEEGDRVTKGMVLARLEIASLERTVKTAELAIRSAEADLRQAELGVKTAESDLKQLQDNVKTAGIDLELASDNYRRMSYPYTFRTFAVDVPLAITSIYEAERQLERTAAGMRAATGSSEYGDATHQLTLARENLAQARQRLSLGRGPEAFGEPAAYAAGAGPPLAAESFWSLRAAQLQADKAQMAVENAKTLAGKAEVAVDNARTTVSKARIAVDKARFDMETARDGLDKAVIAAPFDGIVAKVSVKVGDALPALDFTRVALQVIDPRRMELTVDVDEIDIPGVRPGQEAVISIDALPGNRLAGRVVFISPLSKVEAGVVLYEVKLGFDVAESLGLKAGMSASASIVTDRKNGVLMIPSRAIVTDSAGRHTVKVLVNEQVEERAIVIGISDNLNTEVVSGLGEGDTVVIERQVKTGAAGIFG